jgi:methylenetetrahydrofolate dehydrogenase (NADP+)/methenyltetrahydrofolate cyclohydrolase
MVTILDGAGTAAAIRKEVSAEVTELKRAGIAPGLAVVLVGENPASQVYVRNKAADCAEVGINSQVVALPASTTQDELLGRIAALNADAAVSGILIQLPLPKHIAEQEILLAIDWRKDVDAFTPVSMGRLLAGNPLFSPCTPAGIIELLLRHDIDPGGMHVVILGRSNIVGKPLAVMLMQKRRGGNATVTVCHTGTPDIEGHTLTADIIIAAVGAQNTVTADMVRMGAVVVDVGMNRIPDASKKSGSRLVGDVDFDAVSLKASAISPVPGGVGPMTRAVLLQNTLKAARMQHKRH